jgi:hypothetical protein
MGVEAVGWALLVELLLVERLVVVEVGLEHHPHPLAQRLV